MENQITTNFKIFMHHFSQIFILFFNKFASSQSLVRIFVECELGLGHKEILKPLNRIFIYTWFIWNEAKSNSFKNKWISPKGENWGNLWHNDAIFSVIILNEIVKLGNWFSNARYNLFISVTVSKLHVLQISTPFN